MTALSAPRHDERQTGDYIDVKRVASAKIYHGGAVTVVAASGLAHAGASGEVPLGVAAETVDERNTDQDYVRVWTEGVFSFAGTGFAQTDVGAKVKLSDDQTVVKVTGTGTEYPIGRIVSVESATKVRVKLAVA